MSFAQEKYFKMSTPLPHDPIDDAVTEFVRAIDAFLAMDLGFEVPAPTTQNPNGGWDELKRVYEELKQKLRKAHVAFKGVEPEIIKRLEVVTAKGSAVLEITSDPNIVAPVQDLNGMAAELQVILNRFGTALGKAESLLGVFALLLELLGLKQRLDPMSARFTAARDNLIAYNLMRPRPPESA